MRPKSPEIEQAAEVALSTAPALAPTAQSQRSTRLAPTPVNGSRNRHGHAAKGGTSTPPVEGAPSAFAGVERSQRKAWDRIDDSLRKKDRRKRP
jgi:hypothetical protein